MLPTRKNLKRLCSDPAFIRSFDTTQSKDSLTQSELCNENQNRANSVDHVDATFKHMIARTNIIKTEGIQDDQEKDIIEEWISNRRQFNTGDLPSQFEKLNYEFQLFRENDESVVTSGVISQTQQEMREQTVGVDGKSYLTKQSTYFRKNSQQKNMNNSPSDINKKQTELNFPQEQLMCNTCQHKKAKYHLLNNPNIDIFFCSKCAIKMLQKGYEIQELQTWYAQTLQKMRLNLSLFMERIRSVHIATKENLEQIKLDEDVSMNAEREAIEGTYKQLFVVLERLRNKELKELNKIQADLKSEKQKVRVKLQSQLSEVQNMEKVIQETFDKLKGNHEFKVNRIIEIFSDDLLEFNEYKFANRPLENHCQESRLQKLLTSVYEQMMVDQQSSQTSFSQPSVLNYTEETIEEIKEPFRHLFEQQSNFTSQRLRQSSNRPPSSNFRRNLPI